MQDVRHYKRIKPCLRWAGGKTQLLPKLLPRVPKSFNKFFSLFMGGGALFFALTPDVAYLNDRNTNLINFYRQLKRNKKELLDELNEFPLISKYDSKRAKQIYTRVRGLELTNKVSKAAQFYWLNRMCFNGLYRVNSQGKFNTPMGTSKSNYVDENALEACFYALNSLNVSLYNSDFSEFEYAMENGDFVYLDPPYDVAPNSKNFTAYTKGGFNIKHQQSLSTLCKQLDDKGIKWMQSNAATDLILDLYCDYNIEFVYVKRKIAANAECRKEVKELIIRNYE